MAATCQTEMKDPVTKKEIDERIILQDKLSSEIDELEKKLDRIKLEINEEITQKKIQLEDICKELLHEEMMKIEKTFGDKDWRDIVLEDLKGLTRDQIEFLFYIHRKDLDRPRLGGESTITAEQVRIWDIDRMKSIFRRESCRYCHKISHSKDQCPELAKKFCQICKIYGHDVRGCTKQVRDMYGFRGSRGGRGGRGGRGRWSKQ